MSKPRSKHYRLTEKQKHFAKILPKSESATEAYMIAYQSNNPNACKSSASRLLKEKPEILEYARGIANRNGLTIDQATKTLASKLKSQKVITTADGGIIYVDDNPSQIKASEIALKVHGALKDTDNSVNINVQHNQALILDKLGERMDKVLEMLGYNIGRDAEGRKVIHNLSTSYPQADSNANQKSGIIDAEYDTDSEPTSGGG